MMSNNTALMVRRQAGSPGGLLVVVERGEQLITSGIEGVRALDAQVGRWRGLGDGDGTYA